MLFGAQQNTINADRILTRNGIICDANVIIAGGLGKNSIPRGFGKCSIAGGFGKCISHTIGQTKCVHAQGEA